MFEFEKVCKEIERLDPASYKDILAEKSKKAIDAISELSEGGQSGASRFLGIVLGAVISDGVLSEKEFSTIKPMLDVAFDTDMTFDSARQMISFLIPDPKEYKSFVNHTTDLFGEMSDELKADIVVVCLLVCASDGRISHKERKWLKELIR